MKFLVQPVIVVEPLESLDFLLQILLAALLNLQLRALSVNDGAIHAIKHIQIIVYAFMRSVGFAVDVLKNLLPVIGLLGQNGKDRQDSYLPLLNKVQA